MIERLLQLGQGRSFAALDVELARALGRMAGEQSFDVLLAIALTSRALREGHVCLPLASVSGARLSDEEGAATELTCPPLDAWRERLERSPLVGSSVGAGRPLVLDQSGRLYLARYYDHELRVAERIALLSGLSSAQSVPAPALLDALFPPRPGRVDGQREAALASLRRKLSIIIGGPGTGKTSTVVRLLALLVADALASGQKPPKILLAAPTGKAAQRLSEAIGSARDRLALDDAVRLGIPTLALTLHRALKATPSSRTRFQHHAGNPLDCDILLLDEASMVDLSMMRRLLDALPAHARFIMLGDPDQLAAVEAGGVLFDLVRAAERGDSALSGCLSRLTQSYRYTDESGVAQLAAAVHAQDAEETLRVLRAGLPDVQLAAAPVAQRPRDLLWAQARKAYAGLRSSSRDERLAALDHFRVLCAQRRGPVGVLQLNAVLASAVHGARALTEHYPGRPLLVTQNDYTTALFNGDVGVEHPSRRAGPLCAYFRDETGGARELSLARLPAHESVYAMTVHKSQGSEFDQVAVLLPDQPSPLVSRELLFTAITRARSSVHVYACESALRAAIAQRVERHSGLSERL